MTYTPYISYPILIIIFIYDGPGEKIFTELYRNQEEEKLVIDGTYIRVHQYGVSGREGGKTRNL